MDNIRTISGSNQGRRESGVTRRGFLSTVAGGLMATQMAGAAKDNQNSDPVTINIFSKHLEWLDYEGMARAAADVGFDGVDLTVRPGGHVSPERAEDELPEAVNAVKQAGLRVDMMTTAITDPDDKYTEPILKTAAGLGIRYYRLGYLSYKDDLGVVGSLESYKPALRNLAAMNEHYGIRASYQNHAGTRVGGPVWDLYMLLEDIDPKWIGCQFDIRHATVEGGMSWPLSFKLLEEYVNTLVLKDFFWQESDGAWQPVNCPLGEGMVDYEQYLPMLGDIGFSGPVSLHFEYPLGGADKGLPKLAISEDKLFSAMRRDLGVARDWLENYGL